MSVIVPPTAVFPANSYNFAPQNLTKWRAAAAGVKAGSANARILCIGDSTTFSVGSNGTGTGSFSGLSYPTQLAAMFNAAGINAHANSFMGGGFGTGNLNAAQNDSRITMNSAWNFEASFGTSDYSIGGDMFVASTGTNAFSFTPTANVDTFIVYYVGGASSGSFGKMQADINGGTATVWDTSGRSNILYTQTVTGTLGANTINIKWNANGPVFLVGVEAWDSSKKWVSVINAGWPGAKSGDWNTTAIGYSPASSGTISTVAPALSILNFGITDWVSGTSLSTFKTNVQAIITQAKSTGDVVLATPNPSSSGSTAVATQNSFVAAVYQLAASNNLVLIDNYARWQSYTSSNALGFNYDTLHPNGLGYYDLARGIMNVVGTP